MGGEAGLNESFTRWRRTIERVGTLSPNELETVHQLHRLSQIMAKDDPGAAATYCFCVHIVAWLASKGISRSPPERVFRECRVAIRAYGTGTPFIWGEDLNKLSVEILLLMDAGGRREEALALGRQEVQELEEALALRRQEAQELEALVDQGNASLCGVVANYLKNLVRLFNKDPDEAATLAQRALVLAERARFKGVRVRDVHWRSMHRVQDGSVS
jgi:hypothetical protein